MQNKENRFFRFTLIIPFFNEEKRINIDSFDRFCKKHNDVLLLLVNDGSTDATHAFLDELKNKYPESVETIKLEKNIGKGNAIRAGMEKAITSQIPFTAYMDADLSAPFEEILKLYHLISASNYDAVFGSRLKKLGSVIHRSLFRHLAGRMIATVIDTRFNIGCYDTQCSAKIFRTPLLQHVIEPSFYTRWFSDVEIMLRLKKQNNNFKVVEVPLDKWEHKAGSKITAFSIFSIIKEIVTLFKKY